MATALIIGATGLVGSHLVSQLLEDRNFDKLLVFTRRSLQQSHPKLEEKIIDFDKEDWIQDVKGDVLFSALGTTLRKAGSKEAQYKIDYTYQYNFAVAAARNGVPQYILVSAAYASPNARIFYSRMKGELERDVVKLPFQHISILKPGMLAGERSEKRTGEVLGIVVTNTIGSIPGLSRFKPVHGSVVAKAMINATKHHPKQINTYTLKEIDRLAEMKI